MTVIADSSPVHYAVLIGVADTLLQLYSRLVIPAAVFSELNAPGASKGVRDWIAGNGESIEVRQVRLPNDPAILLLDRGEAEAIVLALESPHPLLIIDDQANCLAFMVFGGLVLALRYRLERMRQRLDEAHALQDEVS